MSTKNPVGMTGVKENWCIVCGIRIVATGWKPEVPHNICEECEEKQKIQRETEAASDQYESTIREIMEIASSEAFLAETFAKEIQNGN